MLGLADDDETEDVTRALTLGSPAICGRATAVGRSAAGTSCEVTTPPPRTSG